MINVQTLPMLFLMNKYEKKQIFAEFFIYALKKFSNVKILKRKPITDSIFKKKPLL